MDDAVKVAEEGLAKATKNREDLELRAAQAQARLEMAQNRANTKARKMETRAKILVGGFVVASARRGDQAARALIELATAGVARDDDKVAMAALLGDL